MVKLNQARKKLIKNYMLILVSVAAIVTLSISIVLAITNPTINIGDNNNPPPGDDNNDGDDDDCPHPPY